MPRKPKDELGARLRRARRLVDATKRHLEENLEAGFEPKPEELGSMLRAEVALANLESFHRLRELTREPEGG